MVLECMLGAQEMTELLILITALLFYYLGSIRGDHLPTPKEIQKKLQEKRISTTPTRYLTPEERRLKGTPQGQVDDLMRKTFEELGVKNE